MENRGDMDGGRTAGEPGEIALSGREGSPPDLAQPPLCGHPKTPLPAALWLNNLNPCNAHACRI